MSTTYNQQLMSIVPVIPYIILLLLPLAIGAAYLLHYWEQRKQFLLEHQKEVKEIKKKFYLAVRMQFFRTPLIVQTTKERAYYNKLIVHYKNSTRKVELMPPNLGEDPWTYRHRIDAYVTKFCIDETEAIRHGQEAYTKYFEKVKKKGLLEYWSSPFNTEKSKAYIYAKIDFLIEHPKVEYGNYKKPNELVLFE
jgi:hypothetical protein